MANLLFIVKSLTSDKLPKLNRVGCLNFEEASTITYMPFPYSNSHYIQLKLANILILINILSMVKNTKQIVCDTLPHLISCTPSCKASCLLQMMPSNAAALYEPLITKGSLLKPTGPKGTFTP